MKREQVVPLVFGLTEGTFVGFGVNYLWEVFRLPGYGVEVVPIGDGQYLGADDLAEIAIGGVIAIAGSGIIPKTTRNYHYVGLGTGIIAGTLLTKLFERKGSGVLPITFGPAEIEVPLIKEI